MRLLILHNRLHFVFKAFALTAISMSFVSCQNQIECPQPICQCDNEKIIAEKIQLSQLDNVSRERLKNEVLSEIKDEMRAEWIREFESEQKMAVKEPDQQPETDIKPVKSPEIPKAIPAPLPPTQKIGRDSGGMKILRHVLTSSVTHRLPVDERQAFSVSDSSVYCFVEISAADAEDRMITIKFTHSTGLSQSYSLPVSQSPAWRTWSKLNLTKSMTGTWLCEVFNEDNELLASNSFIVVD